VVDSRRKSHFDRRWEIAAVNAKMGRAFGDVQGAVRKNETSPSGKEERVTEEREEKEHLIELFERKTVGGIEYVSWSEGERE
jgi:hypothetical protein